MPVAGADLSRHFDLKVHKSGGSHCRNATPRDGVLRTMPPRTVITSLVGLVLLNGCGGSAPAAASTGARPPASSAHSLYMNVGDSGWKLTRVDWSTLRDLPTPANLRGDGYMVASADGSTLAELKAGSSIAVTI